MLSLVSVHPIKLVELVWHLAGYLHLQFRWIKSRDAPHATCACEDCAAKLGVPDAIRAHAPHPGDHDSPERHPPIIDGAARSRVTQSRIFPAMPTGIYISVPFCKQKCSFCNFASGVFSRDLMQRYVDRVCGDIAHAEAAAISLGTHLDQHGDTIYLGGGTPTTLAPEQLSQLFSAVGKAFDVTAHAEITVECAAGTLSPEILDTLLRNGVNRISLGVQSFIEAEARAVGRNHTRKIVLADIERLRGAGIHNISIDLIAGLPHQTVTSWSESLEVALATNVPHISVYMLEVDEDSRLGREVIAGGVRYHAHDVPDDDSAAEFYTRACDRFEAAGIHQYEISNFARN